MSSIPSGTTTNCRSSRQRTSGIATRTVASCTSPRLLSTARTETSPRKTRRLTRSPRTPRARSRWTSTSPSRTARGYRCASAPCGVSHRICDATSWSTPSPGRRSTRSTSTHSRRPSDRSSTWTTLAGSSRSLPSSLRYRESTTPAQRTSRSRSWLIASATPLALRSHHTRGATATSGTTGWTTHDCSITLRSATANWRRPATQQRSLT